MQNNRECPICEQYLQSAQSDKAYYELFFQMCRKFHVDWATASEQDKEFIQEVVRVTYERSCAGQGGTPNEPIRPAFSA